MRRFRFWLHAAGLAAALYLLTVRFVIQPYAVRGGSMEPTLHAGEHVRVEKIAYRFRAPRPGEIVVLRDPTEPGRDLVKRVVAAGGQVLEKRAGHYLVDGEVVAGPCPGDPFPPRLPPRVLGPDQVWVLGDNWCDSRDSRAFGPVSVDLVRGRVVFALWPPRRPAAYASGVSEMWYRAEGPRRQEAVPRQAAAFPGAGAPPRAPGG